MNLKPRFFPNYALYALTLVMVLYCLVLDWIFVPEGETLFKPYFFDEFTYAFVAIGVFMVFYELRTKHKIEVLFQALHALAGFAALYLVITLFASTKSILHIVQPHNLDETFIAIEQFLHFGFLPNTLVDEAMGFKDLYLFLDTMYFLWFFILYIYLCLQILSNPYSQLRERYLVTFAAVWFLLGNVAATLMASVGPIFIEDFFKTETSSMAMNTIRASADIFEVHSEEKKYFAAFFKNMLTGYMANETVVDANTASAMPSVHVAIAALMAFHSYHVNRALCVAMSLYLLVVLAGSVLLCWHYAVDGYMAILLTFGLWKLSAFLPAPRHRLKGAFAP